MEQRRLRLGDILDDYCPRERRVTNHAVVAMIEEDVKQTRCTTCDAEHAYKGGRAPKRRKKETPAALYEEVLAGMPEADAAEASALAAAVPALAAPIAVPSEPIAAIASTAAVSGEPVLQAVAPQGVLPALVTPPRRMERTMDDAPRTSATADDAGERGEDVGAGGADVVDGPVHRRLIRATLPRPEGQKDARPLPEFTVRHVPVRGNGHGPSHGSGNFRAPEHMRIRGGGGQGHSQGHGNGHGHGHGAPAGNRAYGGPRFHAGGSRPPGPGRPPGRGGAPPGVRNGNSGPNKRGRGSRG